MYLYIAGTLLGAGFLSCLARFTCRRVDAYRRRAEEQEGAEIAAGATSGSEVKQMQAVAASSDADPDANTPLITRQRSCCSRFFFAETTGQGACVDAKVSAAEVGMACVILVAEFGR